MRNLLTEDDQRRTLQLVVATAYVVSGFSRTVSHKIRETA